MIRLIKNNGRTFYEVEHFMYTFFKVLFFTYVAFTTIYLIYLNKYIVLINEIQESVTKQASTLDYIEFQAQLIDYSLYNGVINFRPLSGDSIQIDTIFASYHKVDKSHTTRSNQPKQIWN